jgi:hypothetical protein
VALQHRRRRGVQFTAGPSRGLRKSIAKSDPPGPRASTPSASASEPPDVGEAGAEQRSRRAYAPASYVDLCPARPSAEAGSPLTDVQCQAWDKLPPPLEAPSHLAAMQAQPTVATRLAGEPVAPVDPLVPLRAELARAKALVLALDNCVPVTRGTARVHSGERLGRACIAYLGRCGCRGGRCRRRGDDEEK